MKRMLFNATYQEELRVACVDGQKLLNFDIETSSKAQKKGNIYCGTITRVEQSLEACFIDYGTGKQGFLPFKEIDLTYMSVGNRSRDFSKIVEGTKVIVQVEKDERGNKGAALTTFVSLPGRYLVLMPNSNKTGGISRRIDGEEREELKQLLSQLVLPENMSVIARTAALGRMQEELQWDLNYLLKLWNAIVIATQSHDKALIYQESNLVIRSIRDHFAPDISEILIDEESVYHEARNFMSSIMPNFVNKIKYYSDDIQLFSRFQIEHQIEAAYSRTVNLPSGGVIVIDRTEALTAIDVNSAKANKGVDIEATALATNLEAAEEISRQLRLRDVGGLVVVDFIDMENYKNQRDVENYFKEQLSLDRARIQMSKLSKFGLLELSRQRLKNSLEESSTITCPRCVGIGLIRGTESIAVHILRIIQEEVVKSAQYLNTIHVQLPVDVATYLLNERREDVAKLESRIKVKILLIPNQKLESPNYKIKKINHDTAELFSKKMSYNLVDSFEDSLSQFVSDEKKSVQSKEKAAVGHIKPNQPAPIVSNSFFVSLFNNIYKKISNIFQQDVKSNYNKISQNKIQKQSYKANVNQPRQNRLNIDSKPRSSFDNAKVNNLKNTAKAFNMDNEILNDKSVLNNRPISKKNINNIKPSIRDEKKHNFVEKFDNNERYNKQDQVKSFEHHSTNEPQDIIKPQEKTNNLSNNKINGNFYESTGLKKHVEKATQIKPNATSNVLKTNLLLNNSLNMEMVTTNRELYRNRKTPNIKSITIKRYNDIVKVESKASNSDYILVETKQTIR
jgi:ribonuclease E